MTTATRLLIQFVVLMVLATVTGCAETPRRESTGQYVDDTAITTKVKTGIFNEPTLRELNVSVKTTRGVVELNGFADSPEAVAKAGEIAQRTTGVQAVHNNLQVKK